MLRDYIRVHGEGKWGKVPKKAGATVATHGLFVLEAFLCNMRSPFFWFSIYLFLVVIDIVLVCEVRSELCS